MISKKYVVNLINRVLISVIILFISIICVNKSEKANTFVKDKVYGKSFAFTKINNMYNKYFGNILPIDEPIPKVEMVFNETLDYNNNSKYYDGFSIEISDNQNITSLISGIVVFIGDKENYNKTVIIQGIDKTDIWYGNLSDVTVSLYDYVEENTIIGCASKNLYLVLNKNDKYLDIKEYLENQS